MIRAIELVKTDRLGVFVLPSPTLFKNDIGRILQDGFEIAKCNFRWIDEKTVEIFSYHPFSKNNERIEVEVIE